MDMSVIGADPAPTAEPCGAPSHAHPADVLCAPAGRRIGLEIEFAGLDVRATVDLLAETFGGKATYRSRHDASVDVPEFGSFEVGLDTRHAKHLPGDSAVVEKARDLFGDTASLVVPTEITAPPVQLDKMPELDRLVERLRHAGALGTRQAPTNAFALQLNIEAESLAPRSVLDMLRSYLLLEDWLRAEIDVDPSRSLLGFESRFPVAYQRQVLSQAYEPDAQALIGDYIEINPTRNRSLDLLPLFAEMDNAQVTSALPTEKIKNRPAYHYRLPDCRIDEPDWLPSKEWERWRTVERLAADPARLKTAMAERLDLLEGVLPNLLSGSALQAASRKLGASI